MELLTILLAVLAGALYARGVRAGRVERPARGLRAAKRPWRWWRTTLFWSVVIDPEPFQGTLPYAARIVYLLLAGAAQNTLLGGLLAFSTRVFYTHYVATTARLGIDTLTDQRVGGAIMWVPGDTIFL